MGKNSKSKAGFAAGGTVTMTGVSMFGEGAVAFPVPLSHRAPFLMDRNGELASHIRCKVDDEIRKNVRESMQQFMRSRTLRPRINHKFLSLHIHAAKNPDDAVIRQRRGEA